MCLRGVWVRLRCVSAGREGVAHCNCNGVLRVYMSGVLMQFSYHSVSVQVHLLLELADHLALTAFQILIMRLRNCNSSSPPSTSALSASPKASAQ